MSPRVHRRRGSASGAVEAAGHPHLVFRVADETYALPLPAVREIVPAEGVVPVPQAPPILRGVTSFRGEPVPVLDLAIAFGEAGRPDTPETCLLIAETRRDGQVAWLGLVVDAASEVVDLTPAEIVPAPRLASLIDVEFIGAMAHVPRGLVPILDLGRLLASEDVRAAVGAPPAGAEPRDAPQSPDRPRDPLVGPPQVAAPDPAAAVPQAEEPRLPRGAGPEKPPQRRQGAAE